MQTELIEQHSVNAVERAAEVLKNGGLVVFPTETVYGLGALMSKPAALKRIYDIKGRDEKKPLSILLTDKSQVRLAAQPEETDQRAVENLAETYWPGPLTMVLPKKPGIPDSVTAGLDTIGIRVPDHAFALALVKAAGEPVATTSANLSGMPAAVTAQEAKEALDGKVNLIVDGGSCPVKVASTVIGFDGGRVKIYREGLLTKEEIMQTAESDFIGNHDNK